MRACHRWRGAVAAIFPAFIAVTGIALQFDPWLTAHAPPGSDAPRPMPRMELPSGATITRMAVAAADAMRSRHADVSAERIEIAFARVDPPTGTHIVEPPVARVYHEFLQDIHAGYRFGIFGRIVGVPCGAALLVLAITGFTVHLDMFHRRRAGRAGPFWR